jgi:hypothetical protein
MGKSRLKNQITGYRYFFGIHMGIGRGPVDELVEIKVGDKSAWRGSVTTTGPVQITEPELFGGDKQEGGIAGTLDVMMGEPDQGPLAALAAMVGHAVPAFRGRFTAFFNGTIGSNNPYPKKWSFRQRRIYKGWLGGQTWYPDKALIELEGKKPDESSQSDLVIKAMNPAHIIYECLTNREWGRGRSIEFIDNVSFTRAADTLYEEKFGLCLKWSRRDGLQSFVQSVIDHIGAVLYVDRQTAKLTLTLIRKDYDPALLPVYTTDTGLLSIGDSEVSALGPGVNECVVEYVDPVTGDRRTVNEQNLAALQANGGEFNSIKKSYPGLPTEELARRVATRDLRANALALRRFSLTFDRRAWNIPPGAVFRISDLSRGIQNMVVRVGRIEDGTLQNGTIRITAVQDVFGLPSTSFTGSQPPNWTKPNNKPILKRHRAFEVPYFMLNAAMTPADFDYLADDAGFLGTLVEKPSEMSLAYNLYVKPGLPEDNELPP